MNVLIICYYFPPYAQSLGSVQRMLFLALFLKNQGYRVTLLASKGIHYGYFGYEKIEEEIEVVYCEDLYSKIRNRSEEKLTPQYSERKSSILNAFIHLLQGVEREIIIPDRAIFSVASFYRTAVSIIERKNISSVIISSPPHAIQLVGLLLKRRYKEKIRYIADFRDSWNNQILYAKHFIPSKWLAQNLERRVLLVCDYFTYASHNILRKIGRSYRIDMEEKSRLVLNGFVPRTAPRKPMESRSSVIKIGFFGSLNSKPNSTKDMSMFANVLQKHPDLSIEVHFFGNVSFSTAPCPCFHIHPSIDHQQALREMTAMDYLLIVYTDNKSSDEVITGKLFDYMQSKRPILCYSPYDMEARRMIEQYRIGQWIDCEDEDDILNKLKGLVKGATYSSKGLDVELFLRDRQNKEFVKLLF